MNFSTSWSRLLPCELLCVTYDKVLILLKNHIEAIESVFWKAELQNFHWTSFLGFISVLYLKRFTVQVRDKWPTHTQNACTTFAQTRVKKRVPKHAFARICVHLMRVFPFVIHSHNCALCGILLLHIKKLDKRQFLRTLLKNNCISAEKQTADSHVVGVQSLITDKCQTFSQIFLLWTECKRKQS